MQVNIVNKTETAKTVYDFISDNPELFSKYNQSHRLTMEELLDQALCELPYSNVVLKPGENIIDFGSVDHLGRVLWIELRTPGESQNYKWEGLVE